MGRSVRFSKLSTEDVDLLIRRGIVCGKCRQPIGKLMIGQTRIYQRRSCAGNPVIPISDGRCYCWPCVAGKWEREQNEFFDSLFR